MCVSPRSIPEVKIVVSPVSVVFIVSIKAVPIVLFDAVLINTSISAICFYASIPPPLTIPVTVISNTTRAGHIIVKVAKSYPIGLTSTRR